MRLWKSRGSPVLAPPADRGSEGQLGAFASLAELNRLETRIERLELDHAERQVQVLSALEKVLGQLRARERKRQRTEEAEAEETEEEAPSRRNIGPANRPDGRPPDMAALAYRRFRRF